MFWRLAAFPKCRHHVFLSHGREDHGDLVRPVYDRLIGAGVLPWLDREDYGYGRSSRSALQDAIIACRHVVFFVTGAVLDSGRGWCVLELGYTEIVQTNLTTAGGQLADVHLPLFFVPQQDERLPRTVWQLGRDRGRFFDPAADGDRVEWSVREIIRFLQREQSKATELARFVRKDPATRDQLSATPGLLDRVTKFAPSRLPPL